VYTNEEIAAAPIGKLGPVTNAFLQGGLVAGHDIGRPGKDDPETGPGLLQELPQLEGNGQGDIFFFCDKPMGPGVESPMTRIDHNRTDQ
jgi:hypothetical protein